MKDYSIRAITILSFSGGILLILIYLLFSNFFALNVMREKTADNIQNSVQIIGKRTDQNMNKIELCMIEKTISGEVLSVLGREQKDTQYYIELNKIRDGLNDDMNFQPFAGTMFLYYDQIDEIVLSGDQNIQTQAETRELIRAYAAGADIWKLVDYGGKKHLMLMYHNELGVYAGALVSVESILQEWENLSVIGYGKPQYFTCKDNQCIESSGNSAENDSAFQKALAAFAQDGSGDVQWHGQSLFVKYNMAAGDYQIYIAVDPAYGATLYAGLWVLVLVLPVLAVLAFGMYYFIVNILLLKPLKRAFSNIYTEMEKESIALPDVKSFSEVNRVVNMFNAILRDVHDLKIGLYEKKIENERAKMRLLQSQINPHMFMNSLAIINSMSRVNMPESKEVIHQLTQYLSAYFRFMLESDQDLIALTAEIENTENYLKIQCIRYPGKFQYKIETENCENVQLPPLTLQPIVENSIKHGFGGEERFIIQISCRAAENVLTVRICDNGVGFSAESLEMIQSGGDTDIHQKRHFGIKNVYDLLKLAYPNGVEMRCYNDGGAVVEFTIQLLHKQ